MNRATVIKGEDHTKEINRLYASIMAGAKKTVDDVIRIGQLLTEQKVELDKVKYGAWGKWLKQQPFSRQSADNWRNAYQDREALTLLKISKVSDTYKVRYHKPQPRPKPKPKDDPAGDPPKAREIKLTLTNKQLNDYRKVMAILAKANPTTSTGAIVLVVHAMANSAEVPHAT